MSPATPGAERAADAASAQGGGVRSLFESLVHLALAVILFRAFVVEGYMISTGSMAPCLLGFHKRVICPTCEFAWPVGTAYDESVADADEEPPASRSGRELSGCPNCGQPAIDIAAVPRNQGDQLLVHKQAWQFQGPRRWEVVVFRNPARPSQVYVKRVAGLPGEAVQVIDGDLYADGRIQRKDLELQRAIRIPVYDHDHEPADPGWRPRWRPEQFDLPSHPDKLPPLIRGGQGGVIERRPGGQSVADYPPRPPLIKGGIQEVSGEASPQWQPRGRGFAFEGLWDDEPEWGWLTYRHTLRSGGRHETAVVLPELPGGLQLPESAPLDVWYDERTQRLSCVGVLPTEWRDRLLAVNDHPGWAAAVHRLYEESHVGPVTDEYGYNPAAAGIVPTPVRDLMLSAGLTLAGTRGEFAVQMTDGRQTFACILDVERGEVRLVVDGAEAPVWSGRLPPHITERPVQIEMSLMDRQVLAAVDGELLFPAWPIPLGGSAWDETEPPRRPVRLGARGLRAEVRSLKLYRDVHYTQGRARNGIDEPYQLGPDEYFMLGDNSPVSSDSRNWLQGAVPARLLLGKPLVVHLPSRPGELRLGGTRRHIRIPDVSRIRYIR